MTTMRTDQHDDEFDAFLEGKDELSRLLQSLPQPEPSAALDAAILAKAEAELAGKDELAHTAANDPVIPGADKAPPRLLTRWRMPIAIAASVLGALLLLVRWQGGSDSSNPIMVAQAPQPETSLPNLRAGDAPVSPPASLSQASPASEKARKDSGIGGKSEVAPPGRRQEKTHDKPVNESQVASLPREANKEPPSSNQIARALIPDDLPARAAVPTPAATAAAPQANESIPAAAPAHPPADSDAANAVTPANPEKAKAWIKLIEELIKADLRQDALAEWEKFRQAYPRYPVPEKLEAQIRALKK